MTQASTTEAREGVIQSAARPLTSMCRRTVPLSRGPMCRNDLFAYLDEGYNVHLSERFPVGRSRLWRRLARERVNAADIIHSERERMSGTPVFKGSRVPVRTLFNYMSYGYTIDGFLAMFPTVERGQALRALEIASDALESIAYETAAR